MHDSEVETLDFPIVTNAAFVEHSVMSKHISLTGLPLAKAIEDGFGNRVQTITDCLDAAMSIPRNLVVIGTVAKVELSMGFQKLTTFDGFQRATHRIGQTLCC